MDTAILHDKLLEMAVYIDELCREYGINYYLTGGSALGAIRHRGFIPWDDDFDIFMTYKDYRKFIDICRIHLDKERFYLQEEGTKEWPLFYSKLRMNGTVYIEEYSKNRKMHKGFFIDILPLNNVSNNRLYYYLQYISARMLVSESLGELGYNTKNILKKIAILFSKVIVRGFVKQILLDFVRGFDNKETKNIGNFFGRVKFGQTSFPKDYLGVPRYVQFQEVMLPVPEQIEEYLRLHFGIDYMKIPDKKTIDSHPGHAVYINLNKNS